MTDVETLSVKLRQNFVEDIGKRCHMYEDFIYKMNPIVEAKKFLQSCLMSQLLSFIPLLSSYVASCLLYCVYAEFAQSEDCALKSRNL